MMTELEMQITPENRRAANDLFKKGNTWKAIAAYTECITDCSKVDVRELSILHSNLGLAYKKKNMADEAIANFTLSINLDPDYIKPIFQRFGLLMQKGQLEKAKEDGDKILELDPKFMNGQFKASVMKELQKTISKMNVKKIPITILTGFLGSGKTTLLNRILAEDHGYKIAVVENEFGAEGIDQSLVGKHEQSEDQIIEVMNGCICCTVRKDLVDTLANMKEKFIDTGKIDYIIIETTGMADPQPLLQTFLIDEDISDWTTLDSCIAVCDTSQIVYRMNEERAKGAENESIQQVCFSDKVFLNKVDLCSKEQIAEAKAKILEYNTQATIDEVQFNNKDIPFGNLLNLKSFSIDKALKMDKDFLDEGAHDAKKHDKRIGTFSFKMESEMTLESANGFLSKIVMEKGMNIYRMKGFLAIQGSKDKFVFHSVGMLFNCVPFTEWKEGEKKECVFVIIGKELEHDWLKEQFYSAALTPPKEVKEVVKEHELSHSHESGSDSEDSDEDGEKKEGKEGDKKKD